MKEQLLAVYGTLKRGHGNYNHLLTTSEFLGAEVVKEDMTMISMGGFPGLVETPGVTTDIHIEVFKVNDPEIAKRVDRLEGYPGWYDKKEINTSFGKASVYYFKEGQYKVNESNIVKNGNW